MRFSDVCFFKQKTAYELRISDWSSDVCSSDLTSASGDSVTVVRGRNGRSGGKAETIAVTTGRRVDDSVIVTRGLKAGDVVVTAGPLRLQPGAEVQVTRLLQAGVRENAFYRSLHPAAATPARPHPPYSPAPGPSDAPPD